MTPVIVFDLDGTLIDSAPDIRRIASDILVEQGLPPLSLPETRSFIGNGAGVFVAKMRAARGISDDLQDQLLEDFVSRYETAVDLTHPYPGVRDVLEKFAQDGITLGVCTNKPEKPTRAVLKHLGLERYFGVVLGGDSLPVRKPDPTPLIKAFETLSDARDSWVYVGDSEVDAETAQAAKLPFLLFTEGYRKTELADIPHTDSFDDFASLPGLVRSVVSAAAI